MTLFAASGAPRVFGVPPGADFPAAVVAGLLARLGDGPPDALARVTLYVNTARMRREIEARLTDGPARLMPRIRLIQEIADEPRAPILPPMPPPLTRRLDLARLVRGLLAREPDLAPRSAALPLATGLAALADELHAEGLGLDALEHVDVGAHSEHWARSLRFLRLAGGYLAAANGTLPDPEARQRHVIEALARLWSERPPPDPVLLAGSTASRATTQILAEAIARLPQGAVILPGFDRHLPDDVWTALTAGEPQEDHPQFRFAALMARLGLVPDDIADWSARGAPDPARTRLVSLAMRPAPVTDQWRRDGPGLGDLGAATAGMTLIEAPDPRAEANAVALRLRDAAELGQRAALITPDRALGRRVTAALDRWGILPDDSAGVPLAQTAPGRLHRQVTRLLGQTLTSEALIGCLKHPLVHSGGDRGTHLKLTREFELHLRRHGPPFPTSQTWHAFADSDPDQRAAWAGWLDDALTPLSDPTERELTDWVGLLRRSVLILVAGHARGPTDVLWELEPGRATREALDALVAAAPSGGPLLPVDLPPVLDAALAGEVRDATRTHPGTMIWGTLEARVQGADLVILGGLNDGIWPERPTPDPWLNRPMRAQIGLASPDRTIGLAAHDFQQAIGAPEVVLSRALRDSEAETVPSRWLNRLTNLIEGLPEQGGTDALAAMRRRGADWLTLARALDRPDRPAAPARRPSPMPPVSARPERLSVTEIERLIRDPYEVYAARILRLRPLDPLHRGPDPRDRGTVLHSVFQDYVQAVMDGDRGGPDTLRQIAETVLTRSVPWPAARILWLARLERIAAHFLSEEADRRAQAEPLALECRGALDLPDVPARIVAKADRIDRGTDGRLWLYDYKTGRPPSAQQEAHFNKQLLIEAAMAQAGGFDGVPAAAVAGAAYIGLGATPKTQPADLQGNPPDVVRGQLAALLARYRDPGQGYTAQLARASARSAGDYDHLARAGEWDLTAPAAPEPVGG